MLAVVTLVLVCRKQNAFGRLTDPPNSGQSVCLIPHATFVSQALLASRLVPRACYLFAELSIELCSLGGNAAFHQGKQTQRYLVSVPEIVTNRPQVADAHCSNGCPCY